MPGRESSVSIVIPTYGKKKLLATTLAALEEQTYPAGKTEVIVVDDCSRDGTFEYLEKLSPPYNLVRLRNEVNRGRAATRNTALEAAQGEIVIFVDDDMRTTPGFVEEHMRSHELHPWSAIIGNTVTARELGRSNVFSYLDSRGVHKLLPQSRMPARYFLTNNSSVPREALLKAGYFDEAFRNYGFEDMELAFRLERVADLDFWYCPEALAYHIHHHTVEQLLAKRFECARSSLGYVLEKHPGTAHELSVDVLLPPSDEDPVSMKLKKLLVRMAMNRCLYGAGRKLAEMNFLGRLTHPVFDYLIACSYYRGLRDREGA